MSARATAMLVVFAGAAPVHALEDATDPTQIEAARQSFDQGEKLSAAGRWSEAEKAFRHSLALVPRPSTQFNLAVALFYQGDHTAALYWLDRFLARTDPVRDAARREPAIELRERAAARVGSVTLHVTPEHATIAIAGVPVPRHGATRSVYLAPGTHTLHASAPGFEPADMTVEAEPGELREIDLELSSVPPPKPSIVVHALPTPRERTNLAPWVVAIAGAGLLAGSAVTGLLALEADHEVTDHCKPSAEPCDDPSLRASQSRAKTLGVVTDTLWISGAAGVLTGVTWMLLSSSGAETASRQEVALLIAPRRNGLHSEVQVAF